MRKVRDKKPKIKIDVRTIKNDDSQTQKQLIAVLSWVLFPIALICFLVVLIFIQDFLNYLIFLLVGLPLVSVLTQYFIKRGAVRFSVWLYLFSITVLAIIAAFQFGGLVGPVSSAFVVITVIGSMLLSQKESWLFSLLNIAVISFLAYAEAAGWMGIRPGYSSIRDFAFGLSIVIIFLLLIQNEFKSGLRRAVNQSRKNESDQIFLNEQLKNAQNQLEKQADELKKINLSLEQIVEDRTQEIIIVSEMAGFLQSCESIEEALAFIQFTLKRLFPDDSGALYLAHASYEQLELKISWGDRICRYDGMMGAKGCWAFSHAEEYHPGDITQQIPCYHIANDFSGCVNCMPLRARDEVLGILSVCHPAPYFGMSGEDYESKRRLIQRVGEQIALSLSNLYLHLSLKYQAIRDPLTDLYNRRYMEESLRHEITRAKRRSQQVGVIFMDIDHFKSFNDIYGHQIGDLVLKKIGQVLLNRLRSEDIVCRYGGEEFVIIIPESDKADLLLIAEDLRKDIEEIEIDEIRDHQPGITVSIGVASFPEDGENKDTLIRAADTALYEAKNRGRNQIVFYDRKMKQFQ
jgi:diguanylate cyclase (GGDEF)-like protein